MFKSPPSPALLQALARRIAAEKWERLRADAARDAARDAASSK